MKNNNDLFYLCSLVEYMGRKTKNTRSDIVRLLGNDFARIYNYADVFHCESIEKVANEFIERNSVPEGVYDNIAKCKYEVPDYWDIGEVFARLIEDCYEEADVINGAKEVYDSWMAGQILNFNSDLYYQSREYIALCYKEGKILSA